MYPGNNKSRNDQSSGIELAMAVVCVVGAHAEGKRLMPVNCPLPAYHLPITCLSLAFTCLATQASGPAGVLQCWPQHQ